MRYTWAAKDIICGRYVCAMVGESREEKPDSLHSRAYKIGFLAGADRARQKCLVSIADGMITFPYSDQELADHFNKEGFAPLPHKWLVNAVNEMRGWYEGD